MANGDAGGGCTKMQSCRRAPFFKEIERVAREISRFEFKPRFVRNKGLPRNSRGSNSNLDSCATRVAQKFSRFEFKPRFVRNKGLPRNSRGSNSNLDSC